MKSILLIKVICSLFAICILQKFVAKNCLFLLNQSKKFAKIKEKIVISNWGDTKMIEDCKKENGEIKEAIEQLEEMSADEKERELYEMREKSRLIYNTEMYEARRKGLEEGEKIRRETW